MRDRPHGHEDVPRPLSLTIWDSDGLPERYYLRVWRSSLTGEREIETLSASRLDIHDRLGPGDDAGKHAWAHVLNPRIPDD
jgi:hypothetical protein